MSFFVGIRLFNHLFVESLFGWVIFDCMRSAVILDRGPRRRLISFPQSHIVEETVDTFCVPEMSSLPSI